MKEAVTKRQKELLICIYNYIKDTGFPPSFEEMRGKLGVSSNQSVSDHLKRLVDARLIQRNPFAARGIAILPLGYEAIGSPSLGAFLGATSAGAPVEAVEITGEWVALSQEVARLQGDVFLLKVHGDSMINAGIDDGDVVMAKQHKEFSSGDIVLARVGSSATIKRFMSVDKPPYVYLKPENPKYNYMLFTDETEMTGKIISVLKNGSWTSVR